MEILIAKDVDLDSLCKGSALTIPGAGGDPTEYIQAFLDDAPEIFKGAKLPDRIYTCKGSLLNEKYYLTGDNAYPDDITFLFIELDYINMSVAAVHELRLIHKIYRWFDDIVSNNKAREMER